VLRKCILALAGFAFFVAFAQFSHAADKPVQKAPATDPTSPLLPLLPQFPFSPQSPCMIGGSIGGLLSANSPLNSTSGFYHGASNSNTGGYFGALADCKLANLPSDWRLSAVPTVDLRLSDLSFSGTGGGFPVNSSGNLKQLDYFLLLKLTRPITPKYDLSIFAGPGAATLWPRGNPTGPGGPFIVGTDTAFAMRTGVEISQALYAGWLIALNLTYQYTAPTKYPTTLAGEEFRLNGNSSALLGLNVQCCDYRPPPPPGNSTVERLTPPPEKALTPPSPPTPTPPGNYTPVTTKDSVCGPDITDRVLEVLRKIRQDYKSGGFNQAEACEKLTNLKTGGNAWDIADLGPEIGGYWFTPYVASKCAIPRPQCSASVEFLGTCQNAQTVNYVMWGMLTSLCKIPNPDALLTTRNLVIRHTEQTDTQVAMAQFARNYARELDRAAPADVYVNPPPPPDITKLRERFIRIIHQMPQQDAIPESYCALSCPIKAKLPEFHYRWHGMNWDGKAEK